MQGCTAPAADCCAHSFRVLRIALRYHTILLSALCQRRLRHALMHAERYMMQARPEGGHCSAGHSGLSRRKLPQLLLAPRARANQTGLTAPIAGYTRREALQAYNLRRSTDPDDCQVFGLQNELSSNHW